MVLRLRALPGDGFEASGGNSREIPIGSNYPKCVPKIVKNLQNFNAFHLFSAIFSRFNWFNWLVNYDPAVPGDNFEASEGQGRNSLNQLNTLKMAENR